MISDTELQKICSLDGISVGISNMRIFSKLLLSLWMTETNSNNDQLKANHLSKREDNLFLLQPNNPCNLLHMHDCLQSNSMNCANPRKEATLESAN